MGELQQTTLGLAAIQIGGGVQVHHLSKLARLNAIPHTKAGRIRLVKLTDLEAIRRVCQERGYYRAAELASA